MEDRYLIYNYPNNDSPEFGFMHNLSNFKNLLLEAYYLKRIAILPNPSFDPKHNNNYIVSHCWEKYIDFDSIKIQCNKTLNSEPIKCICRHKFDLESVNLKETHRVNNFENADDCSKKYLIRDISSDLSFWGVSELNLEKKYRVILNFSKDVIKMTNLVLEDFQDYIAIHVRRGDRMMLNPKIKKFTNPKYISSCLLEKYPNNTKYYLMSDEKESGYFDFIKENFDVKTYKDFPFLKDIVQGLKPDNFMLFSIEKLIYYNAKERIGTFIDSDSIDFSLSPYSMHEKYTSPQEVIAKMLKSLTKKIIPRR